MIACVIGIFCICENSNVGEDLFFFQVNISYVMKLIQFDLVHSANE